MEWNKFSLNTVLEVAIGVLIALVVHNMLFRKKESYDTEEYLTYQNDNV